MNRMVYNNAAGTVSFLEADMQPKRIIAIRGLKQDWIAGAMGISASYLSLLIDGKRRWSPKLRRLFALAVGIALSAISFDDEGTLDVAKQDVERIAPELVGDQESVA